MSVLAHPTFRTIPPCKLPLQTREGQREYDTYARALFEAGRLTNTTHTELSLYASAMDAIAQRGAEGKAPTAFLIHRAQKSFRALRLENDEPVAAPLDEETNRFQKFGAPTRRRQEVRAGQV